uniref:Uncharacterized protein n=1 Tax=Rhodosorus marinus TaxID=101924 RepID=A0A7S0BMQ0_9RHOD|mmetsp:Transcript_2258/g.3344  ORF Transcript_2258/g.3344 Transcript_2258/m.3344 type:complete len:257 (+) Transcript_2258:189-959(+)
MANKGDGGFQPTDTDPIMMGTAGVPQYPFTAGVPQYPFTAAHTAQTQFTQAANGLNYLPRSDIEPKRTTGEMREYAVGGEYDGANDSNLSPGYPAPSESAPSAPAVDDITKAGEVSVPELGQQAQGPGGVTHVLDSQQRGFGYGNTYNTPKRAPSSGYGTMTPPQPQQYGPPSGGYGYPPAPGYNGETPVQLPYSSRYGNVPTDYPQQGYGARPSYPNMPPDHWVAPNQQPSWSAEQVPGNPASTHAANSTHVWNH